MDLLSIASFNNPSPTGGDSFSAAGELATATINPNHYPQPKRSVGRPKGSKNKPKIIQPPQSPRLSRLRPRSNLNSTAVTRIPAGEPTNKKHILQHVKRLVGRPNGSKNKPKTSHLNSTAHNNYLLWPAKRPVGRPKGSKNKPNNLKPQDISFNDDCNNPYIPSPLENVQTIFDNQETMGSFSKLLYQDDLWDEILCLVKNTLDEFDPFADGLFGLHWPISERFKN